MRKIVLALTAVMSLNILAAGSLPAEELIDSTALINPLGKEISSPHNWIHNGSFEKFDNGTTQPPNGWEDSGPSDSIVKDNTNVKFGNSSLSLKNGEISQVLEELNGLKGREVVFGAWIKSTITGDAFLTISDGLSTATSETYQSGEWKFLTVKTKIDENAAQVVLSLTNTANAFAYFDGAALYQTTNNLDFVPNPEDEVTEAGVATDLTCTDCIGAGEIADGLGVSEVDENQIQKRVTGTCSSADQSIKTIDVNGNVTCETDDKGITSESDPKVGTLTSSYVPKWGGSSLSNSLIYDSGSKIGIGTASPSYTLDLTTSGTLRTNRLLDNGTSVGIGTSSPSSSYILDVNGTIHASDINCASTSCIGASEIKTSEVQARVTGTCTGGVITAISSTGTVTCETDDTGSAAETDPQVGTNTTSYVPRWDGSALSTGKIFDNGSTIVSIATGTKVGIGTASPAEALHVLGNIRLEGTTTKITNTTGDICIGTCP